MAMTIVESTRPVTGGVDTHCDVHVAAAVDPIGGVLGVESFATTPVGYRDAAWLAGLVRARRPGRGGGHRRLRGGPGPLPARDGVTVIEVDRPNRQARRQSGKSDPVDAVEAARAALSGRASGIAKSADGDVEAIRALIVARRSARGVRIKSCTRSAISASPAPTSCGNVCGACSTIILPGKARVAAPPCRQRTSVTYATKLSVRTLAGASSISRTRSLRIDPLSTIS